MSFKTLTEAWGNGSVSETLAFKCKDCIPSITHTHKTPSPPQQQQKEHTGAFKNISA